MNSSWIIDVIDDCREYSKLNGLERLEEALDAAMKLAKSECSLVSDKFVETANSGETLN